MISWVNTKALLAPGIYSPEDVEACQRFFRALDAMERHVRPARSDADQIEYFADREVENGEEPVDP